MNLTQRELIRLKGQGFKQREMAHVLGISESAVSQQLKRIEKLQSDTPRAAEEKRIQDKLSRELQAAVEIQCPAGFIDILSATEIIEIKRADRWKSAVGQVLAYQIYFPNHRPRIHLFWRGSERYPNTNAVLECCSRLKVLVSWEPPPYPVDLGEDPPC